MSDLPELHGWLPARDLARRLGVSPGTVRARARSGAIEAIPNPVGQGHLYRAQGRFGRTTREGGGAPDTEVVRRFSAPPSGLPRDDRVVLAVLPASGTGVARALGIAPGTAHRRLMRLREAGLVRRGELVPSGPRGGRQEIIWRAVA